MMNVFSTVTVKAWDTSENTGERAGLLQGRVWCTTRHDEEAIDPPNWFSNSQEEKQGKRQSMALLLSTL